MVIFLPTLGIPVLDSLPGDFSYPPTLSDFLYIMPGSTKDFRWSAGDLATFSVEKPGRGGGTSRCEGLEM